MFKSTYSYKKFLAGAFIGGAAGVLTALALRTKQGKKIQKELYAKYKELENKAQKMAKSAPKKIKSLKAKKLLKVKKIKAKSR